MGKQHKGSRWVALALASSLMMGVGVSTPAGTVQASGVADSQQQQLKSLKEKKESIQKKIDEKETVIKVNDEKVKELLEKIKEIDSKITEKENKVKTLGDKIQKETETIKKLQDDIIGIEQMIEERDGVLRERLVAMQKTDKKETYVDVLLGSTSFSDFMNRFSAVSTLLGADRKMMNEQEADKEKVEANKEEVETIRKGLVGQKEKWEKELADITATKKEKSALIDELEKEQLGALKDMSGLEKEYGDVTNMEQSLEDEIIKYQIALQVEEMEKLVGTYCQTGTELDKKKFDAVFADAGALTGQGDLIIKVAQKYKIDPVLMASVILHETGNGTSNAVKNYNNPGGIMNSKTNWSTLVRFDTLEDGLNATGSTLSRMVNKEGKKTIQQISEVYAPIGADNDPNGLNKHWTGSVTENVKKLGGMEKDCKLQGKGLMAGKWVMPAEGRLTSQYGWRMHPIFKKLKLHRGTDIANVEGTPVKAAGDGVVSVAGRVGGFGNCIMITHVEEGRILTTVYAHLSKMNVLVGDRVTAGQGIGAIGTTGNSTGPHLHFEVHEGHFTATGDSVRNPLRYITQG